MCGCPWPLYHGHQSWAGVPDVLRSSWSFLSPRVNVKGYTVLPREGNFSVLEVETPALPHTPATLLHTWLVLGAQTDLDETLTL